MIGLITLDAECYAHNLATDRKRIADLERENTALLAEIERLNQSLDRALPATPHTSREPQS